MATPDKWQLLAAYAPASKEEDLADALAALWQAAREAWPGVEAEAGAFMRALAARAQSDLGAVRTTDLYLARACLERDPAALAALDARVIAGASKAIAGVDPSRDFIDEVSQVVRERLLLGAAPRLEDYQGRGSLLGWARTIAVRLALNMKRDGGKENAEDADLLAQVPLAGPDVELQYVRAQHREDFLAAFREALDGLEARERNVLRLSYLDHLSIDQIGAIYAVHRGSAARWLSAARETLVERTREGLAARLKLTPSELEGLLGALQSNMEISLRGFLGNS